MASSEHIKRLARELILPDQADLVLQRPKYWKPAFCWRYFDRVDQLISEVPAHGLMAAEVCSELVYLTRTVTRESQDRLQLRALAIFASALRANDDLDQAEQTYKQAFELIRGSRTILPWDAANVLFRFSYVLCFRNQYQPAVGLASQSITIYREAPEDIRRRHLGEALIARGYIHDFNGQSALAMKDWGQAVTCTDVKLTPRVFFAGVHNLASGIMESTPLPSDLSTIENYVTQASRYYSKMPLSAPKLKVLWLLGMIQLRFGSTRRGEATYRRVITGFLKLSEIVDATLVSVLLGKQLHREGLYDELKQLAIETNDLCERFCRLDDIKRAVFIWKQSVLAETVSADVFATTWKLLEKASYSKAFQQQSKLS